MHSSTIGAVCMVGVQYAVVAVNLKGQDLAFTVGYFVGMMEC